MAVVKERHLQFQRNIAAGMDLAICYWLAEANANSIFSLCACHKIPKKILFHCSVSSVFHYEKTKAVCKERKVYEIMIKVKIWRLFCFVNYSKGKMLHQTADKGWTTHKVLQSDWQSKIIYYIKVGSWNAVEQSVSLALLCAFIEVASDNKYRPY